MSHKIEVLLFLSVMLSAVVKVLAKKKKKINCYPNETFQQLTSTVHENFVEDVCFSSPSQ